MSTRQREFGIADNDRELFETTVSEAFLKEIQKARKFEIVEVDDITESTIIMRGAVLDIVSFVPPPHTGRSDIYLASIGEATLVLELIDAKTGEVAAVVAERRRLQSGTGQIDTFSMPTNRATVIGDIRRWARRSAVILRDALDEAIMGR